MNATTATARIPSSALVRSRRLTDVLATHAGSAGTVLRVTLAAVMFPHGAQKLLGWWGGYGFEGSHGFLTGQIGLPGPLATGIILLEFIGPLLLVLGLLTRPFAVGLAGVMLGAIVFTHWSAGFFMPNGYECVLALLAAAVTFAITGAGRYSVDALLRRSSTTLSH